MPLPGIDALSKSLLKLLEQRDPPGVYLQEKKKGIPDKDKLSLQWPKPKLILRSLYSIKKPPDIRKRGFSSFSNPGGSLF